MHDRGCEDERRGSRHDRDCDERHSGRHEGRDCCHDDRHRECREHHHRDDHDRDCDDRDGGRGGERSRGGPDTRFLQLEMSQVLYGEAEALTHRAFRELLLEAAKGRLRERFGDKITGIAQLAIDELMDEVQASLDIEARIQERTQKRARMKDRLRDIFAERERRRGSEPEPHGPEGKDCEDRGESGGRSGSGSDENR